MATKLFDVMTVGSATIDVFAHTDRSELIKIISKDKQEEDLIAYPSGAKILITDLKFMTGGGGTNTAVALSRLGLRAAWIGMLGSDENAKRVLGEMKKEKVTFVGRQCGELTGYSVVLDSIEHDRTILAYKGANNHFSTSHFRGKRIPARWLYITAMVEKSYGETVTLAKQAKKQGVKIMYNPSSYLAEQGLDALNEMIKLTDVLCVNKEEAQLLVGKGSADQLLSRLNQHVPIILITDGKDGAYAADRIHAYRAIAPKVKVVETTGAGDAFGSSFLAGFIKKEGDIQFALSLAMTNACYVIQYIGAKNKLLTWNEAAKAMRKLRINVNTSKIGATGKR